MLKLSVEQLHLKQNILQKILHVFFYLRGYMTLESQKHESPNE